MFAHRGASGEWPENTLEAFAAGLAAGADRLELDIHATADGHVVVIHDESLARTTDGSGLVRALPLARVQRYDAGHHFCTPEGARPFRGRGLRIPTLDELLDAHPDVPLNVEIKQDAPPIEAAVLRVLDGHGARDRVLLAAEDGSIMRRIRAAAPDALTGFSLDDVLDFVGRLRGAGFAGYRPPGLALQLPPEHESVPLVTPDLVRAAHDFGVEVHVWTVNTVDEVERLLDLGVDGIMTDFPARAMAVYRRRALR